MEVLFSVCLPSLPEATMRPLVIAAVALLLAGVLVVVSGQASYHADDDDAGDQPSGDPPDEDEGEQASRGDDAKDAASRHAREAGLFGQLSYDDPAAEGSFVSFTLDASQAEISDYVLKSQSGSSAMFDSVGPEEFDLRQTAEDDVSEQESAAASTGPVNVSESRLLLQGEALRLRVHDDPTGLLAFTVDEGEQATLTFELAAQATAGSVVQGDRVHVSTEDRSGTVILAGNGSLQAGDETISLDIADGAHVVFYARPADASSQAEETVGALAHAIAEEKLASFVRAAGVDGSVASQIADLAGNASALEGTAGRARIEMDTTGIPTATGNGTAAGTGTGASLVHIVLDDRTIPVPSADEVVVKVDGREVEQQASIDDVVNASGNAARAHVLQEETTVAVTVRVPSPGVHTILVKQEDAGLPDLPDPEASSNPTGASGSLAAQGEQQMRDAAEAWQRLSASSQQMLAEQAGQARVFSAFENTGPTAEGTFLDVRVEDDPLSLQELRVEAGDAGARTSLVSSIEIDAEPTSVESVRAGPTAGLIGPAFALRVHDAPTAPVQLEVADEPVQATYELAQNVSMKRVGEDHVRVTGGSVHAHLVIANGDGSLALEGDRIRQVLGANAQSFLLVHPAEPTVLATGLHDRLEAMEKGVYGAQIAVASADNASLSLVQSTSIEAQVPAKQPGDQVTLTIEREAGEPRMLELLVPKDAIGAALAEHVAIELDGETVPQAGLPRDIYDQAGTDALVAHVQENSEAFQILVSVDTFSSRELTVYNDPDAIDEDTSEETGATAGGQQAPSAGLPGVLVACLAVAAGARRLRRR